MDGISTDIKEAPEISLSLLLCEVTAKNNTSRKWALQFSSVQPLSRV